MYKRQVPGGAGQASVLAHAATADPESLRRWEAVPGFWSTIGEHTLKHAAWGDGHEQARMVERTGGFTLWYTDAQDRVVGVLTYNADEDYERGRELVAGRDAVGEGRGRPDPA